MLKKLTVSVLAVAFAFMAYAPAANAQFTTAQLEAAGFTADEIALLQAFLGTSAPTTTTGSSCPAPVPASPLTVGTQSPAVMDLQRNLNALGFTVSATGAGSVGMETMFFGPATRAAVAAYQNANPSILTAAGLTTGSGYYGTLTANDMQLKCQAAVDNGGNDNNDGDMDNGDDDMDDDNDLRGGEASLEQFDLSAGDDSDVEEGQTAEVAEFEFDVEDGDVEVNRVDVVFAKTGANGDNDPWDVFESASLMMDGDEVASMDVDDEDDWLDDDGFDIDGGTDGPAALDGQEAFVLRFSGLEAVVRENDQAMFTLEVTAQNNVDDADMDVAWTVFIQDRGIRAVDSEDIQNYTGDATDSTEFDVEEAGEGEELTVKRSSNDPDAATIQVEDDENSDEYVVFVFDVEAEDNDIDLETVTLDVTTGTADYEDVVRDAYLVIDGEEFDDLDVTNGDSTTATLEFDIDSDVTIDEDEEVEVELVLEFRAANGVNYSQPETVEAGNVTVEGEGEDDVSDSATFTGETHTLLVSGLYASEDPMIDTDAEDGVGTFEFVVTLSAFEEDAYILAEDASEFNYTVVGGATDSVSALVSSSADIVTDGLGDDYYVVPEGGEETFTLTVTVDPTAAGSFRVDLNSVDYAETEGPADTTYNFVPVEDYRSSVQSISA